MSEKIHVCSFEGYQEIIANLLKQANMEIKEPKYIKSIKLENGSICFEIGDRREEY